VNDGFVFLWSVSKHGAARLHSSNKCISTVHAIAWMGNSVISVGIRHVKVWRLEHVLPASPTKMRTDMSRLHDGSSGSPAPKTFSGRNCLLGSLLDATFTCVAALSDLEAILCTERGDICLLDDTDKKQRLERVAIAPFKVFCISVHKENGTVFLGGKDGKTQELPIQSLVPGASPGSNNESPSPISPTSGGPELCSDILAVGFLRDHVVSVDASHQITIRRPRTFDFSPFSDTDAKLITAHESAVRGVNTLSQPNPQEADFMTWSSQGTVLFWTLDGVCKDKLAVSLEQSPSGPHGTMNELKLLRASSDTFIFGDRYGNIGLVKKPLDALRAHNGEVNDLALARKTDGVVLVASCGRDRTLQLFQLTGDSLEISQTMENEHAASVNSLMFVNKGAMLISGSADRTIIIRTMAIGSSRIAALSPTRVITLKSSPTSFTTMADDSDTLIVSTMDRQIHNFDLRTGSLMHTFKATDSAKIESVIMTSITVVHLHSEAYHVPIVFGVSSTDKSIRAYDNETGVMLAREYGQLVVSDIAYLQRTLADGCVSHHAVSTGLDGTVIIWDLSQQANHQVGLNGTVSCGTTLSESSMSIKPLRKILSRSELLGFQNPSDAPQDPCTPTRSNHSSRVRKKTSRLTLASTPKQNALMRAKSTQHSPTPSVSEAKDLEGSRHPSATKPPKKESAAFRAKRSSSNASPRYQIGTKCSDNLVSLSEKVCQTLREYRGHISASSRSLNSVQAEQVERELTLTIHAVKATTRRSDEQASGGANEDGSIDGWLAKMIDERLALRLERAASDDGKVRDSIFQPTSDTG
jgi:WD40 repeat protein